MHHFGINTYILWLLLVSNGMSAKILLSDLMPTNGQDYINLVQ